MTSTITQKTYLSGFQIKRLTISKAIRMFYTEMNEFEELMCRAGPGTPPTILTGPAETTQKIYLGRLSDFN